ncbi:MAG: glycosyltransferase, partial [Pseudomonadota bacterium]
TQPAGARQTNAQPERPRIAFYARRFTARRAVDLGLLALEELSRRGHAFFVDFFGADQVIEAADYPFINHGVVSPTQLAALYRDATIGVVFSATNYSLVPQEMMASGLPLVELDVESTQAIYPDAVATRAAVDPIRIADAMEALLFDPERRARQRDAASEWVAQFSWDGAVDVIESALTERLAELGHVATAPAPTPDTPKVSVVIPTLNGGERLMDVLERVKAQTLGAPFEILAIDSGSTDGTLERMEADPAVMVHRIPKSEFGHGRTRNLGVELTSGDYVAFLTQDALPVGDNWLSDLVIALDHYPMAGGAFGRHIALPDADPFTKRDMDAHFRQFLDLPLIHARDTDPARWASGDVGWRQILHFYSDNSSILRRSVWKEIPMRDVAYGEDQLFARDIVEAGYQKIYVPSSVVEHSHDYDEAETYERARTESAFFLKYFGYDLMPDGNAMQPVLDGLNASDEAWALAHGVPADAIEARKALNAARLRGHLDGRRAAQAEEAEA